mgnify:CR=1 FL=1
MSSFQENQQGDVSLYQTPDDGDIEIKNGIVTMESGLQTAAYLSMFGGNLDDSASGKKDKTWWGNLMESETQFQLRSQTQFLLRSIPATPFNLVRINDAVQSDLKWMIDVGAADEIDVSSMIPSLNKINIKIDISANKENTTLNYSANWGTSF